jgi:hypothetical protein
VEEGAIELSLDWPHVAVVAKNTISKRASLQFPIRVNSFSRLKSADNAYGNGSAGKQGNRLAQIFENSGACALFRNENGVPGLQSCAQNISRPPFS